MAHDRYRVVIRVNGEYPDMFDDNPVQRTRFQCISMHTLLHVVTGQGALRPMSRYTPLYHELASALDHILTEASENVGNARHPARNVTFAREGDDGEGDGIKQYNMGYIEYTPIVCNLVVQGPIDDAVPPPPGVRTQAFAIFAGLTGNNVVYAGGFETNKISKTRKALNALKEKKSKAGHAIKEIFKPVGDLVTLLKAKYRF